MSTTNFNTVPTGVKVDTIENVMSVRDIGWEEGSDHITITTDDQVHTNFNIQVAKIEQKSVKFRCCCILWRHVVSLPHVRSVQQREVILCVAGVLWKTSVLGVLSVRTVLNQEDGSPALTSASLPLSLPHSSFWTLPPS